MDYDVIVAGAGPVGSTVARAVAQGGFKVLVVEEHPKIGVPAHCTGKFSSNALRELGLEPPGIQAELRGAIFHSPSGIQLTVERKDTQAYILDRKIFDSWLASKALESGAELGVATRATKIALDKSSVHVTLRLPDHAEEKTCRVVVAADGVASSIARQIGLYSKKPTEIRSAAQKEFAGVHSMNPGFAEVFLGSRFAPGFFAWLVPMGMEKARIGLCVKPYSGSSASEHLDQFAAFHPVLAPRLKGSSLIGESVHAIPTGGTLRRTVARGVLVVGDAAGQVKSTTGGGLYYGILCACIAGETLCNALNRVDERGPCQELEDYEERWRSRLGEELSFTCRLRAFMDSLSDEEVDYLFGMMRDDESLARLVESLADIDYQSRVARKLLPKVAVVLARRPRLLSKATRYLLVP